MSTIPEVLSVNLSEKKGTVKHPVDQIEVTKTGILNDAHSGRWHRQVSLLGQERIEEFSKSTGKAIKYGDFAENITTSGIDLASLKILDRLEIGSTLLEVTQIGKECHGNNCAIFQEVGKCVMPKEGIFTRTVREGTIRPGDRIILTPRPVLIHIITLSDRASTGEYEDKSGPEIENMIRDIFTNSHWQTETSRSIIPDDRDLLEKSIQKAMDSSSDIIITTGGTGISTRDITPDVISSMIRCEIPGIMDHIRLKYGAQNPNALISRSIAGMIGQTMIFALPGSVKAVREYMTEIGRLLQHLLLMANNIGAH